MESLRKHRDIKLVTTEKRRNNFVTFFFSKNLVTIKMKKKQQKNTQIHMNKPVCLGLQILEISKTVMHEFWFDYVKR